MSLQEDKFPDAVKIAKVLVTHIYKKRSKDVPGNYRLISVLPVLGKIFEKIVNERLIRGKQCLATTSVWLPEEI